MAQYSNFPKDYIHKIIYLTFYHYTYQKCEVSMSNKLWFEKIDQELINDINLKLNMRPRKKLLFDSPLRVNLSNFDKSVALGS